LPRKKHAKIRFFFDIRKKYCFFFVNIFIFGFFLVHLHHILWYYIKSCIIMAKYHWNYISVGGSTRVKISSGEDIRHLPELDRKLWTVLACPTTGLEMDPETLKSMDTDHNGKIRIDEVVETSQWLCTVLKDPKILFKQQAVLPLSEIADEAVAAVAKEIAGEGDTVALEQVDEAIAAVTVEEQPVPEAPLPAEVIAAYKACKDEYTRYYELEKLQKLGLARIPEETVAPGMTEKKFADMGAQIQAWEEASAAAGKANADALAAAKARFAPLRKLLLLSRDYVQLLHNFVTFEDFYDLSDKKGIFQAGTLLIDQRACHLCMRVSDMSKHDTQASFSGMFLVYCDCVDQSTARQMQIVAAVTVGEINNLTVGKNAVFYDRQGNDWDATIVKVIDNPISIKQAFWTPYRKLGKWVEDKINQRAAEKEQKQFEDLTANVEQKAGELPSAATVAEAKEQKPVAAAAPQAFDIAKFAGIFAAIGMAVGMIGSMLVSVAKGWVALTWWQQIIVFLGIMMIISGPSMILAYLKLRRRNLSPLLNANGWAVNADAIINVLFGATLTDQARYPMLKLKDPFVKEGMPAWQKWAIAILVIAVVAVAAWLIYVFALKATV
jgi:hypothetical protein